jgi:hypothetical protein
VVHAFTTPRAVEQNGSSRLDAAILVLATLAWQCLGAFVVSTHFRLWTTIDGITSPSLDRYLLPLMPLSIALALWAVRNVQFSLPLAGYAAFVLAVFAVAGTRDNLVFHQAQWAFARHAQELGIAPLKLDAGASWGGFHYGEQSYAEVGIVPVYDRRWWLGLFAGIVDPQYAISTAEHYGYVTVEVYPYDLWLDTRPAHLYLIRRENVPGPP